MLQACGVPLQKGASSWRKGETLQSAAAKPKLKKDKHMQLAMTRDEIVARVNNGNSFTREEMSEYRNLIKVARDEKKQRLSQLTGSQLGTIIEQQQSQGFTLVDTKVKEGKRTDTLTYVFKRKSQDSALEYAQKQAQKWAEKAAALANR